MSDSSDEGGGSDQANDIGYLKSTLEQMLAKVNKVEKNGGDNDIESLKREFGAEKIAVLQKMVKKTPMALKSRKQNKIATEPDVDGEAGSSQSADGARGGASTSAIKLNRAVIKTPVIKLVPLSKLVYGSATSAADGKDKPDCDETTAQHSGLQSKRIPRRRNESSNEPESVEKNAVTVKRSQSMSKAAAAQDENQHLDDDVVSVSSSKSSSLSPIGKRVYRTRQRNLASVEEVPSIEIDDSTDNSDSGVSRNRSEPKEIVSPASIKISNALIVGRQVTMKKNLPQIQFHTQPEREDDGGSQKSTLRSKRGGNKIVIEAENNQRRALSGVEPANDDNRDDDEVSISSKQSSLSAKSTPRSHRGKSASVKEVSPANDDTDSDCGASSVSTETKGISSPTRKITMKKNLPQVQISNQRDVEEAGTSSKRSTSTGSPAPSTTSRRELRDREQPANESSSQSAKSYQNLLNSSIKPSLQLHPLPDDLKSLLKPYNLKKIRCGKQEFAQSSPSPDDDSDADRHSNESEKVNKTI